jgi:hypothetical protein
MRTRTTVVMCALTACTWVATNMDASAQVRGARGGGAAGVQGRPGAPGIVGSPAGVQSGRSGAPVTSFANVADDPFSGPVVANAPFSAEATTSVTQVLSDGTRIEENTTARFYRDSAGRVRREQTILGLGALNPSSEARTTITIDPDPGDATAYTLDPATKTARRVSRSSSGNTSAVFYVNGSGQATNGYVVNNGKLLSNGSALTSYFSALAAERQTDDQIRRRVLSLNGTPVATAATVESLGTRQMEGITVVGRRSKTVIPTGQIGNDRPIEITDERWESQDLKLLVRSHHHDPRTGDIDYQLTNIVRVEPPGDLFAIPGDYKTDDSTFIRIAPSFTIQTTGQRGTRSGGGGGGGPRSGAPAN